MSDNNIKKPQPRRKQGGPMGGPMGGPAMGGEKAKNFKSTMKKLVKYMNAYYVAVIAVIILSIASTVFAIFGPKILGRATDKIFTGIISITAYDNINKNMSSDLLKLLPENTTIGTLSDNIISLKVTKLIPQAASGSIDPNMTLSELINNKELFSAMLKSMPAESAQAFQKIADSMSGQQTDMLSKVPKKYLDDVKTTSIFEKPSIDFKSIGDIMLFLIFLYGLSALFGYLQGFIMSGVSMKITYKLRKDISEKINVMPLKYFDKASTGDVLSRVTNDVDTVSQTLNQSLSQMISSVVTIVGIFVMMLTISPLLTLVTMLILPLSMVFIMVVVKKSQKHFKKQQKYLGLINGHVEEMYGGHTVMKVFNGEKRSIEKFDGFNDELYKSGWKSQFLSGLMMPIVNFISNVGYVAVCVVGAYLTVHGQMTVGNIQSFIQYLRQFTQPLSQIANITNVLQSTAAAAERVFEFLEEEEEIEDKNKLELPVQVEGAVTFQNVRFGYADDKIIIKDFSAEIKPGQRVAIVGPTGAGKTTIVKLLMRFYELQNGKIFVDGKDVTELSRSNLRQMFGMVLQDTWLFNGSIMENIRYGRLDANDQQVIAAAGAAHVDEFVHALPNGYNMELNEEASNISGGQKQLLTIARAILADPQILILDEATSSVDTRTETLIQRAMDNLMQGRTSFIIAHRLSTIKNADIILVMNEGDIIEQGNHEALMEQKGFYYSLYNSQFENSVA